MKLKLKKNKTFIVIIFAIAMLAVIVIIFLLNKKSCFSTSPTPSTGPSIGPINGIWTSIVGCGGDYFNLISLASALPQDYDGINYSNFFIDIIGTFNPSLSSGNAKYLLSIGGSNATPAGWISFIN